MGEAMRDRIRMDHTSLMVRLLDRELILKFFSTCRIALGVLDLDTLDVSSRMIASKADLRGYWDEISSSGDFLTTVPSYTQIREPLKRYAEGRKQGAKISRGPFIACETTHFERFLSISTLVALGLERQQVGVAVEAAQANEKRLKKLKDKAHRLRKRFREQCVVVDGMSRDFVRFTTWAVGRLGHLLDASVVTYPRYKD
nr:hypothetical protein [Tanacetum cinerariifolium]